MFFGLVKGEILYIINTMADLQNCEGLAYLDTIEDKSIDLVLTDPPYITSRDTGMDALWKQIHTSDGNVKTLDDWNVYRTTHKLEDKPIWSDNYQKYGTIYGKKYAVRTQYGDWDSNFTMDDLNEFLQQYYKKLRQGGTLIIWFDIWKITPLKELLEGYGFKQIRFIEWIKTNPQPLNSKVNYLTNSREIALVAVKGGKPTFNSSYDTGIYSFPIQGGKNRFHPTQKSVALFEELIRKHSNEGDTVLDTFLGSGTTALACRSTNRTCKGCEISLEYYNNLMEII